MIIMVWPNIVTELRGPNVEHSQDLFIFTKTKQTVEIFMFEPMLPFLRVL